MSAAETGPRVIVALDYPDATSALNFVSEVDPSLCRLKVGKELFTRSGPDLVRRLVADGFDLFLDLKFHDIPRTVARACAVAAEMGVWMMNVHVLGGRRMLEAAAESLARMGDERPRLIGVTILTSLERGDLEELGLHGEPAEFVLRYADLAADCGLDGVVCSPREVAELRPRRGDDFLLVTPGVRPAGAALGDQRRVMTPGEAIAVGSSYLVVGRPVTEAEDPLAALKAINREIRVLTDEV